MLRHTFLFSSNRPFGYWSHRKGNPAKSVRHFGSKGGSKIWDKSTKAVYCRTHGHEHEAWRGEWVVVWKQDAPMIKTAYKVGLLWSTDREMPLENVGLARQQTQGGPQGLNCEYHPASFRFDLQPKDV